MKSPRICSCFALAVLCSAATGTLAQSSTPDPVGPVPTAIITAKSIFVSNAGSDRDLFPGVFTEGVELPHVFTGDTDRPYTEFYAALKATGDYQLASDPSQADLSWNFVCGLHMSP